MVPATVRFFCPVGSEGDTPSDFAYRYAWALHEGGYPLRVLPVGSAPLAMGAVNRSSVAPCWRELARAGCFTRPLSDRIVNIVCCPAGLSTGLPLSGRALAGAPSPRPDDNARMAWAQTGVAHLGQQASRQPVYQPSTALAALWYREAIANIAITFIPPAPSREELTALAEHYSYCVTATETEAELLVNYGLGLEDPDLKVDGFARLPILSLTAELLLESEALREIFREPIVDIATRKESL